MRDTCEGCTSWAENPNPAAWLTDAAPKVCKLNPPVRATVQGTTTGQATYPPASLGCAQHSMDEVLLLPAVTPADAERLLERLKSLRGFNGLLVGTAPTQ